jgi:N-hydroxyarylamine O-acetyltransferase
MFRLARLSGEIHMQAGIGDEWRSLYRFDLTEQMTIDYDAPNWYACTHPASRFTNDLMVARAVPGKRYTMLNNQLSIRDAGTGKTKKMLRSAEELRNALKEFFGIAVPDDELMEATLRRLASHEVAA